MDKTYPRPLQRRNSEKLNEKHNNWKQCNPKTKKEKKQTENKRKTEKTDNFTYETLHKMEFIIR